MRPDLADIISGWTVKAKHQPKMFMEMYSQMDQFLFYHGIDNEKELGVIKLIDAEFKAIQDRESVIPIPSVLEIRQHLENFVKDQVFLDATERGDFQKTINKTRGYVVQIDVEGTLELLDFAKYLRKALFPSAREE